ncbi:MAG TPA: hypothetical protein VIX63_11630 [Vicinamibacterales bacterium]
MTRTTYLRGADVCAVDTIVNNSDGGRFSVTFASRTPFAPPAFPSALPRDAFQGVPINQLPPRNVQIFQPDLVSPRNQYVSIGCVRELAPDPRGVGRPHQQQGKQPDPADRHQRARVRFTRHATFGRRRRRHEADGAGAWRVRLIEQDESTGQQPVPRSLSQRARAVQGSFAFDLAYTVSRIESATDDITFRLVDSRRPEDGFGRA